MNCTFWFVCLDRVPVCGGSRVDPLGSHMSHQSTRRCTCEEGESMGQLTLLSCSHLFHTKCLHAFGESLSRGDAGCWVLWFLVVMYVLRVWTLRLSIRMDRVSLGLHLHWSFDQNHDVYVRKFQYLRSAFVSGMSVRVQKEIDFRLE